VLWVPHVGYELWVARGAAGRTVYALCAVRVYALHACAGAAESEYLYIIFHTYIICIYVHTSSPSVQLGVAAERGDLS